MSGSPKRHVWHLPVPPSFTLCGDVVQVFLPHLILWAWCFNVLELLTINFLVTIYKYGQRLSHACQGFVYYNKWCQIHNGHLARTGRQARRPICRYDPGERGSGTSFTEAGDGEGRACQQHPHWLASHLLLVIRIIIFFSLPETITSLFLLYNVQSKMWMCR